MSGELTGKTALVTGAGRGIGRAIAERLATSGALVAILDAEPADDAIEAIERNGGAAFWVQSKIGEPGSTDAMLAGLDAKLSERGQPSAIDVLVNNIGGGHYRSFEDTDVELLDWTWALNVKVPFLVTQALLPQLNDGGRVINISSAGARLADPDVIAYCMCKAAINNFTLALAKKLGPRGITVNAVCPGTTNNETNAEFFSDPEMVKLVSDDTLLRRVGQPSDIAEVVHALASSAGSWITGQIIEASGGYKF